LESSKECVTTHQPNGSTLKMDGANPVSDHRPLGEIYHPKRVGGRGGYVEEWL